jgi:hypothetical protein
VDIDKLFVTCVVSTGYQYCTVLLYGVQYLQHSTQYGTSLPVRERRNCGRTRPILVRTRGTGSGSAAPPPLPQVPPKYSTGMYGVCTPYFSAMGRNQSGFMAGAIPPGDQSRSDRGGGFAWLPIHPPLSRATLQSHASSTSGADYPNPANCVRSVSAVCPPSSSAVTTVQYRMYMHVLHFPCGSIVVLVCQRHIASYHIHIPSHPIPSHPPFPPASRHTLRPSGLLSALVQLPRSRVKPHGHMGSHWLAPARGKSP